MKWDFLLPRYINQHHNLSASQSFVFPPMNSRNFPRQKGIIVFLLYWAQKCYRLSELWTELHKTQCDIWDYSRSSQYAPSLTSANPQLPLNVPRF